MIWESRTDSAPVHSAVEGEGVPIGRQGLGPPGASCVEKFGVDLSPTGRSVAADRWMSACRRLMTDDQRSTVGLGVAASRGVRASAPVRAASGSAALLSGAARE